MEEKKKKMPKDWSSFSETRVEEENDSPTLPEDVILDIIIRNSGKDVCRARALSKAMYYATYESFFIRKHCEKVKRDTTLIISFATHDFRKQHFYSLIHHGEMTMHMFSKTLRSKYATDCVLHPCNGLVCFTGVSGYGLYLCNPGLKQFKFLSRSGAMRALSGAYRSPRYGFAFDTSCDQYTLVNVIHDRRGPRGIDGRDQPVRCEYLRLIEKRWHGVADECPLPLSNFHTPVVLHNTVHWRVCQHSLGPECPGPIVSFNLGTMRFSIIRHPKTFLRDNKDWPCLGLVRGNICLTNVNPISPHCIQLYVLSDYENQSWSMLNILVQHGHLDLAIPICFWDGRIFMRMRWHSSDWIISYNRGESITELSFDGMVPNQFSVYPYFETIVNIREPRMCWGLRPRRQIASD